MTLSLISRLLLHIELGPDKRRAISSSNELLMNRVYTYDLAAALAYIYRRVILIIASLFLYAHLTTVHAKLIKKKPLNTNLSNAILCLRILLISVM